MTTSTPPTLLRKSGTWSMALSLGTLLAIGCSTLEPNASDEPDAATSRGSAGSRGDDADSPSDATDPTGPSGTGGAANAPSRALWSVVETIALDAGFENGASFFAGPSAAGTIAVDDTVSAAGDSSLRVTRTADTDTALRVGGLCCSDAARAYTFAGEPGPLRVSAAIRADAGVPVHLTIVCMGEDNSWLYGGQQTSQGYANADWGEIENVFTCVEGTHHIGIGIYHDGPVGSSLWIDDVTIESVEFDPDVTTADFNTRRTELPGVNFGGTVVEWPEDWELDYFAAKGMQVVRIPLNWEVLQEITGLNTADAIFGDLDESSTTIYRDFWNNEIQNNFDELDRLVAKAESLGIKLILNLHNYDKYDDVELADDGAALASFWRQLAARYKNDNHVLFGLMNEPATSVEAWSAHATAAIAAIRDVDAPQPVLVYFLNDARMLDLVSDPEDNIIWEVHNYSDADGSGTSPNCVSETRFMERLSRDTSLFRGQGQRAFLGEMGAGDVYIAASDPENVTCYNGVRAAMNYLGENNDVWSGWAWWSAGHIWRDYYNNGARGYMYDLTPMQDDAPSADGDDSIAMDVLEGFL